MVGERGLMISGGEKQRLAVGASDAEGSPDLVLRRSPCVSVPADALITEHQS